MDIGRNGADVMFKGKRQQRTGKPRQPPARPVRDEPPVAQESLSTGSAEFSALMQPEQGDIGDSEVRHTLVAFPAHRHQTLALRP